MQKSSLLIPLRTHLPPEAKVLAQRLTFLSDIAFARRTETMMAIGPDMMAKYLEELGVFLVESHDLAREVAPQLTAEAAAYEAACAQAAIDALRRFLSLRDREHARQPLREAAQRLGVALDENDADWPRLAYRALRVMLDAAETNARRDSGVFDGPSEFFKSSRAGHAAIRRFAAPETTPAPQPQTPLHSSPAPVGASASVSPSAAAAGSVTTPASIPTPDSSTPRQNAVMAPPASAVAPPVVSTNMCPTIEAGTEDYIEARSKGYRTFKANEQANPTTGASWVRNSAPNVRSTARLMSRILGNRPFNELSDADLMRAWELVARIPHTYQAKTSKMSPREAADEADATEARNAEISRARLMKKGASPGRIESEILMGRIKRLRAATIYRHMQNFQRSCVFQVKRGHFSSNIMADHIWEKAEYERREILEEDNERLTWCGKLDGLFRTPIFQGKLDDAGDPMFWAPLIAVHMGLRSEEVLQLYVEDIKVIDEVPCIVLKQGPGQSLKSKASRRTVPIHENLLELGFMQLVASLRRTGEPRLFSWLERSENKKTFTETFSKRFTRYRKDYGVYDAQRDFHSFRTTFNHLLIRAERQDSHRRALMGHVERDVGITNYNSGGFAMTTLRNCVNSVEIDISMIRSPFATRPTAGVIELGSHRAGVSI